MRPAAAIAGGALATALASSALAAPRAVSLDQCADQYLLALSPRASIAGLSRRALNSDSYLAPMARGLPLRRATSESVLAARPEVVVRYWGGDERLLADLSRRGVRVVRLDDATSFDGVRANVRRVAAALGGGPAGEALIARMDRQLAASAGAWRGAGALYLTSGGATAGGGTLIDAMMRAAGLTNLAGGRGFHSVRLEALILAPPTLVVLGFFEAGALAAQHWGLGRLQALRTVAARRAIVSLPGALLGCPAWFAADGAAAIARAG